MHAMRTITLKTKIKHTYIELLWPFFSTASSKTHFHLQHVLPSFLSFQPEKELDFKVSYYFDYQQQISKTI